MGSAWRVGETHFNRLPHPPGFARQLRTHGGRRVCEEIPVSIPSTVRRAVLLRGLSAPEGALALCRNALERCCAALRPRRNAALLGVLVRAGFLRKLRGRAWEAKDLGELGRRGDVELVVAAVGRLLVGAPAQKARRVTEAIALEVIVFHFADALDAQRFPGEILARAPAAVAAGHAHGAVHHLGPMPP